MVSVKRKRPQISGHSLFLYQCVIFNENVSAHKKAKNSQIKWTFNVKSKSWPLTH